MIKGKTSGKQALLRAVSALSISLGVTAVALADESPKEIGSATGGAGSGKVSNQIKGGSNQFKYDSHQIKGGSNQLKYNSNQLKYRSDQYKQPDAGAHELNPQPLPPG